MRGVTKVPGLYLPRPVVAALPSARLCPASPATLRPIVDRITGRVLLLAVRDRDRRVEVQPELFTQVGAGTCSPRRRTGLRPRGPHRRELFGPNPVQDPPRGRHRGHRTEQLLPIGQHTDAADRVRAIGYCHREIGEHPPRRMSRHALAGADQSVGDTLNQTRVLGHLPQQTDPGVRYHAMPVRADHDPTYPACYASPTECLPLDDSWTFEPPKNPKQDRRAPPWAPTTMDAEWPVPRDPFWPVPGHPSRDCPHHQPSGCSFVYAVRLPLVDGVGQVGHPLRRLCADRLQGHAARVHALEQADSGAEQHG